MIDEEKVKRARLLLLSKFYRPKKINSYDHWSDRFNKPIKEVISDLLGKRLLKRTATNKTFDMEYNVVKLKDILKRNKLKMNGKKSELIDRIINNSPNNGEQYINGILYLELTENGKDLVEKFKNWKIQEKENAENRTYNALIKKDIYNAVETLYSYEAKQVFSRGMGISWEDKKFFNVYINRLTYIFSSNPKILEINDKEKLFNLQVFAGMMELWGSKIENKWFPEEKKGSSKYTFRSSSRMIVKNAHFKETWNGFKEYEFDCVKISGAYDVCPSCERLRNIHYKLDESPGLPYIKCTHPEGCRCFLQKVVKY